MLTYDSDLHSRQDYVNVDCGTEKEDAFPLDCSSSLARNDSQIRDIQIKDMDHTPTGVCSQAKDLPS